MKRNARWWLATLGTAGCMGLVAASTDDAGAKSKGSGPSPQLVELGRRLFFDPTASRLGKHACADCHDPDHGFSDARKLSIDDDGPTKRHSQPLTDLRGFGFHWDGEFRTVRQLLVARVAPVDVAVAPAHQL